MQLDEVGSEAERLAIRTRNDGIDVAYQVLEAQLASVSSLIDIDSYLPGGGEATLGMAGRRKDGRAFFLTFRKRLRERFCAEDGPMADTLKAGTHASASSVVTTLNHLMGLPPEALGLLIPLSVIISSTGIDAFCNPEADVG